MKLEPGSVVLTPAEVATLRDLIDRWELACDQPGANATKALVDLGCEIRDLLTQASDDERKPVIR
jgi:hypothetical protein